MNLLRLTTLVLWIAPLVTQCVIAVVMVRRRLVGQFPFFFSYTLLLPLRDLALTFCPTRRPLRHRLLVGRGRRNPVSLAIVFEIAGHFVRLYPFLRLFLASALDLGPGCRAVSLALLFWTKGPGGADVALEWITLSERSARFLQVCLLIVAIATDVSPGTYLA